MPYTASIYSVVRDEILENGKSIVEISKMLNMSTAAIENIAAAVFDLNRALEDSMDLEIRHMIVKEYLSIDRVSSLLNIRASIVRRSLAYMVDESITGAEVFDCKYAHPYESESESSDESSESESEDDDDSASSSVEDTEAKSFRIPLPGRFDTKVSIYFNHVDRDEFDVVTLERRPKSENGTYYITYTADVPNSQSYLSRKSRCVLEADGLQDAMDYIRDLVDLLELDTLTFKSVDIMMSVYPTVTLPISSLLAKKKTLLRLIEDSLVAERYLL
jgi:hypothetical protein